MKPINLRSSVVAAAILPVAFGLGCGSGDESESLTKAQLGKEAAAICKKAEARQVALVGAFASKLSKPVEGRKSEEELVGFAALPPLRSTAEELSELTPPASEQEQFEAFIAAFERAIAQGEADPGSLLPAGDNPFEKSQAMAANLGLKGCGGA